MKNATWTTFRSRASSDNDRTTHIIAHLCARLRCRFSHALDRDNGLSMHGTSSTSTTEKINTKRKEKMTNNMKPWFVFFCFFQLFCLFIFYFGSLTPFNFVKYFWMWRKKKDVKLNWEMMKPMKKRTEILPSDWKVEWDLWAGKS